VPVASVVAGLIVGFCKTEVKPFGPVQPYVEPALLEAVNISVLPEQIGELLVRSGALGVWLITTVVVENDLQIPRTAVTVYVPDAAVVTGEMLGFCNVDANRFGPDQLYPTPSVASVDVSSKVLPEHTGLLLPATGSTGVESTTTAIIDSAEGHPASVAITE